MTRLFSILSTDSVFILLYLWLAILFRINFHYPLRIWTAVTHIKLFSSAFLIRIFV